MVFVVLIVSAGVRRVPRVSDVNAMGYSPAPQPSAYAPNTFNADNSGAAYNYNDQINVNQNNSFAPNYSNQQSNQYYDPYSNATQYGQQQQQAPQQQQQQQQPAAPGPAIFNPNMPNPQPNAFSNQLAVLQQPIVQEMAMQYGKQLFDANVGKYGDIITRLKYYFAVDNNYVVKKLILLLFPFHHRVSLLSLSIISEMLSVFHNFDSFPVLTGLVFEV